MNKNIILKFLGSSGALSLGFNSNMLISYNDKNLLFDCGEDIKHSLAYHGEKVENIDAIYISHPHMDHCGGIAYLGFYSYFVLRKKMPLYIHEYIKPDIISICRTSMGAIGGKDMELYDYFDLRIVTEGFNFNGLNCHLQRNTHIIGGIRGVNSFGLLFRKDESQDYFDVYISGDSAKYACSGINIRHIFHDCDINQIETQTGLKPGVDYVHIPYSELCKSQIFDKCSLYLYHCDKMDKIYSEDILSKIVEPGSVFEI